MKRIFNDPTARVLPLFDQAKPHNVYDDKPWDQPQYIDGLTGIASDGVLPRYIDRRLSEAYHLATSNNPNLRRVNQRIKQLIREMYVTADLARGE